MTTVQIEFLIDHPAAAPVLAKWFRAEWPDYYADRTLDDIEGGFRGEMNRDRLPVRLIALEAGDVVGTIVLRDQALQGHPEYRPGLGGLYVAEHHRNRGVGTELVRGGMAMAVRLGFETLVATTETARRILERLGWERMDSILHDGERLGFYRFSLKVADANPIEPARFHWDALEATSRCLPDAGRQRKP